MVNFRLPGFPKPENQDTVKFIIFKSLPYSKRIILYFLLLTLAFTLQIIFLNLYPGLPFLIFASLLTLVKGYDNRVKLDSFYIGNQWAEVNMNRIEELLVLDKNIKKWDRDALDISNSLGCIMFPLVILAIIVLALIFDTSEFLKGPAGISTILLVDGFILILPLWFNGIRSVLRQDTLQIKANIMLDLYEHFNINKGDGVNFIPSMLLSKDREGKSIPKDLRFTVKFEGMPAEFYGVQGQININDVQGTKYPYFYCVIPAQKGFGLANYKDSILRDKNTIVEYQEDREVEVIVIRQFATKTSGYHTRNKTSKDLMDMSILGALSILRSI